MPTASSVQNRAAERVYRETKEGILSGEIQGGTLLSEAEVARALDVSRTPAREAFVRLEAEGLLSLLPRRGALVTPLSPTEAVDVLEIRHALELGAVTRLSKIAPDERHTRLETARQAIEAQSAALAEDDVEGFIAADELFHFHLVSASQNKLATSFYATLGDRQRRMTAAAISVNGERLPDLVPEHRALLSLAAEGDHAQFSAQLWDHLRRTHAALSAAF